MLTKKKKISIRIKIKSVRRDLTYKDAIGNEQSVLLTDVRSLTRS